MSNRSRSSSKRASRASKQPGLLETLTRAEKRATVVDEEDDPTCTVIDLDDDDPYKFVDSQSLLPDSGGWTAAAGATGLDDDDDDFTMTSLLKLTSTPGPSTHRKTRDDGSNAGGVSTPKRSRTLGGATGSAKRKQTPKSKKSSVQQEEWSEEDMKMAIEASLQEKQREERRRRQVVRESKAEEEERLLLARYQSMAATAGRREREEEEEEEWREGDDDEAGREEGEEPTCTSGQPGLPSDRVALVQQKPHDLDTERQSSPISVTGLANTATPQLKSASVSIKKLSMKSLQTKKRKRTSDFLEEELEDEDEEVQIVTLQEEGKTAAAPHGEAVNAASSSTSVKEVPKGMERYCIEDEVIPDDDDFDATPPILGGEGKEAKCEASGEPPQTVVSKPLSRGTPVTAATSKRHTVSAKQGERGRTKSTKTGLRLKKGRKRLSDPGNSSFQELPHSSCAQGPASKRPRIEVSDSSDHTEPTAAKSSDMSAPGKPDLTTDAELATSAATAAASENMEMELQVPPTEPSVGATASEVGSKEASDNGGTDRVTKVTGVKQAVISLAGTEQTHGSTRKGVDFTTDQNEKINELREKSSKKEKLSTACSSAVEIAMETDNTVALPSSAVRLPQQRKVANTERASLSSSAKLTSDRDEKDAAFQLVRRVKADGWPPVKIQPLETPRHSSLQAPPGVLPAEHTKVLIQCFNAYVAKLAMAQRKVLWRMKWGQPVSSFNKVGVNTLTSGRRTRRSRATGIPYSEYALDLQSKPPSSRSKSSSPMVSSKRSTPSKSPVSGIREQFSPGDEDDSGSDFEPSKAVTKRTSNKKSNVNSRAGKTPPTSKSQRATKSRLTLGKRSPQLQERADKSVPPGVLLEKSLSPGVQLEREESPDILPPPATRTHRESGAPEKEPSTKPSGRRLEFGVAGGKSTVSVSPLLPRPATTGESPRGTHSPSPPFQDGDDNVLMLDLTSPSPPLLPAKPHGSKSTSDRDGTKGDDLTTSFSGDEKETEKAMSSHPCVSHDTTDDSNEEGHPQSVSTSAAATTAGATSTPSGWLDSRKPPPAAAQKTKSKRQPAKRTSSSKAGSSRSAQSKKKTGNGGDGGGGGGRGRRQAKTTMSAALRIKALIEKSDSEAESGHSSLEDGEGDDRSKETVPRKPPGQRQGPKRRRTMDSSDDSEVTDMEPEDRGGEGGESDSSGVLTSRAGPMGRGKGRREVIRSNHGSHTLESVIDLTAESQLPRDHIPSSSPSPLVQSLTDDDGCVPCPMCGKRFDSSVIQLHAEQCEGPESDNDNQWSETIARYTTATKTTATSATTSSKPGGAAAAGGGAGGRRKGSLSMGRSQVLQEPGRGGRGAKGGGERGTRRKSYQPSLMQLVNKEREMRGEEEIDSDTTTDNDPLDDLLTSDRGGTADYYADTNLEWTEGDRQRPSATTAAAGSIGGGVYGEGGEREDGPGGFDQLSEDGEGGFIIEPSPCSTPQPEPLAVEDGEGGYIVDPSTISNSPIRCFTRLSDMDPQERAWYEDQYKAKSGRGRGRQGRRSQRGAGGGRRQLPMTSKERESATWGRDDFGDLFSTDERSKGQVRRGRGRGGYRGRKYDWNKARNRGKTRGRGRGRAGSRGRRS